MTTESAKDDRPRKKKKKKKKDNTTLYLWLGVGAGVLLLFLIGGGVLIAWRPWERADDRKVGQAPAPQPQPDPGVGRPGGEVVKNPKTLLGNIRARGAQIERDAEMVGIVALYHAYCDEVKSPNQRNLEGFLLSIRAESGKIVKAVKDKDYLLNYRARISSDDIVVYESEPYDKGYFCFRANNQPAYVSAQELKAALGK